MKGSAVLARLRYAREFHGTAGFEALMQAVEPSTRAIAGELLPQSWVPFAAFVDLNVEADKLFGCGDLTLCYHMGRFGADVNLTTLYRVFFKLGNPGFILARAAKVWSVNFDSGSLDVDRAADGHAFSMTIADFASPHRAHCLGVLGWAARSVELSGGKLENAVEVSCRARGNAKCEFFVRWK